MAEVELEIDQSHLPRVEEVRQNFAVLEDGVLAHSLQEQEIEHYYMTNIQKNQLVQNDIRMAKKLQDEEEEQRAQYSALLRQTSRQMEERDFEYARVIQEEIQRRAEEARRREMDDEELAKQIQEEEEERIRRTREESSSGSEEQYTPFSSRGQRSTSDYSSSQFNSPQAGSPRGHRTNACLRSSEGHSFRDPRERFLSEESDGSDTVFSERSSVRSKTVPSQRHHHLRDRNYGSLMSHTSFPEHCNDYERAHLNKDYNENGYDEGSRARNHIIGRDYRQERDGWHRNQDLQTELAEVRERRCKRTESVRLPDRRRQSFREAVKTWAYKDNPDKHVRFHDESAKSNRFQDRRQEVWEMLGQVLRERGVPVRMGDNGAPLQIGASQRRDSHSLYGSEATCSDTQPHHRAFQRAVTARHSFHGDIRERRRKSFNREQTQGQHCEPVQPDREIRRRESNLSRERQGSRRWKEHKYVRNYESNGNEYGITRTTSERRPVHNNVHRSAEEERPDRRVPNRSQSLSSSRALRSRHTPSAERDQTSLELGELQQVLHDEELARKLQEEEERVLSRNPGPSPHNNSYPDGDFRVAQVAQDEEIARYMQKQEIKSKHQSRELEGPISWREHRAMMRQHDRRTREVPRERLDSEGLPSPTEDCSPEDQPHSPVSTLQNASQIRNIAEELDPTFQVRRPGTESLRGAQTGSCCAPLPAQQSGLQEEPTFIPPTKRQAEKSVRPKSKEKRENCKQQ